MMQRIAIQTKLEADAGLSAERWRGGWRRVELAALIALAAIYLFWFTWPLAWSASANARLVGTFITDEETHVRLLQEAIIGRTPRLGYIQYGYTYLNLGLAPLFVKSYFKAVTEQEIIVWLRMLSALFGVGTIAVTFVLSRRYMGHFVAWAASFLLAVVPRNFMVMSSISHADIPQLFFMMLGLYFCSRMAEDGRRGWFIGASLAAGLAFGCKYTGLFLLPILWFVRGAQTLHNPLPADVEPRKVALVGRLLAAAIGCAALGAGLVLIPHVAGSYGDARYFGIALGALFQKMRLLAIGAGIALGGLAALNAPWRFVASRPRLAGALLEGVLSLVAFWGAFGATAPFHIVSIRSGFIRGFIYESLHSSFGEMTADSGSPLLWWGVLVSPEGLDGLILGLAGISLVATLFALVKEWPRALWRPRTILWIWVIYYLGFLVWRVSTRTHRALLPVIPPLVILAAQGMAEAVGLGVKRLPGKLALFVGAASLVILVGLELPGSLGEIVSFRETTRRREEMSVAVRAGYWLAERYPASARVLYDPYSYVPPAFADAQATPFGGTLPMLALARPDIVIVSREIEDRFSDASQAGLYATDEQDFLARHDYYAALRQGTAGYVLVRDFGEILVYAKP